MGLTFIFRWNRTARDDANLHRKDNVVSLLDNYKNGTTKKNKTVRLSKYKYLNHT